MIWKMPASSVSTAIALAVFHQHGLQALGCGVTSEQAWRPQLVRHVSSSRSFCRQLRPLGGILRLGCILAQALDALFATLRWAFTLAISPRMRSRSSFPNTPAPRLTPKSPPSCACQRSSNQRPKGQRLDVAISKWSYHKAPLQHRGQHSQGYHDGQRGRRLGAL
jgi:hypothetical protein